MGDTKENLSDSPKRPSPSVPSSAGRQGCWGWGESVLGGPQEEHSKPGWGCPEISVPALSLIRYRFGHPYTWRFPLQMLIFLPKGQLLLGFQCFSFVCCFLENNQLEIIDMPKRHILGEQILLLLKQIPIQRKGPVGPLGGFLHRAVSLLLSSGRLLRLGLSPFPHDFWVFWYRELTLYPAASLHGKNKGFP